MKIRMLEKFLRFNDGFCHSKTGLSLIECAMAVLVAGTAIITVLEISTNTIGVAMSSSDNRLGSLLASEIIALEAPSMYEVSESPYEDGETISDGEQEVDTERFGEQYKDFRYEVTKKIEEIDIETELSDDEEEDDGYYYPEEEEDEEELPTVKIARIKVVIYYPLAKGEEEPKTLTVETIIKPNQVSLTAEEEASGG